MLACPGVTRGHVRVEQYDVRKSTVVQAHESELAQLVLSADGSRLATASDKGALLRTRSDARSARCCVSCGAGSTAPRSTRRPSPGARASVPSDKGTVHVFPLRPRDGGGAAAPRRRRRRRGRGRRRGAAARRLSATRARAPPPARARRRHARAGRGRAANADVTYAGNARSNLSFLRRVIPGLAPAYLESEWSFAQIRGTGERALCAFGAEPNTIVVVGADGSFLLSRFVEGGEGERLSYSKFIRSGEHDDDPAPGGGAVTVSSSL